MLDKAFSCDSEAAVARVILTALVVLAAPMAAQSSVGACPAAPTGAEPFGPATSSADSGRLYTSRVSPDGREFWFFRKMGASNSVDYRIFRAFRERDGWGAPEQVHLGSDASDLYPSLSPDGQRLVFSSYRPVPGDTSRQRNAHLYVARRHGSGWSEPQLLRASVLGHYHAGGQHLEDGSVVLDVVAPDWQSRRTVRLPWLGDRFADSMVPYPLHPAVTYWRGRSGDSIHVWNAFTSSRGLTLVGVSQVLEGGRRGPANYFMTEARPDHGYTDLRPATGIPGPAPNFAWFSDDGCWLHFTRNYSGFMRIAVSALGG